MIYRPRPGSGARSKSRTGHDDVAVLDDDAYMTGFKNFSIQDTISNIENDIDDGNLPQDDDEDIMPSAAAEMGAGTLKQRFLLSLKYLISVFLCSQNNLNIFVFWVYNFKFLDFLLTHHRPFRDSFTI